MGTLVFLAGCSSNANKPTLVKEQDDLATRILNPYRPDIVQGNVISRDLMDSIRPGMSKEQVRVILGTPLLNDIFHVNRWDYIFMYRKGESREMERRKVTLTFDGNKLAKVEADTLPTEKELIEDIDAIRQNRKKAEN